MRQPTYCACSLLPFLLFSCGSERPLIGTVDAERGGMPGEAGDAAVPKDLTEGVYKKGTCPQKSENLLAIPESVTAFRHVSAPCDSVAPSFLVKNTGHSPVRVTKLAVTPRFALKNTQVPIDLEPGAYATIAFVYLGDVTDVTDVTDGDEGSDEGALAVYTSTDCVEVPIRGNVSTDALMDYSARAIDFGDISTGETRSRTVQIQGMRTPRSLLVTTVGGFSVIPEETFEIVEAPEGNEAVLGICEPIQVKIQAKAGQALGSIEGHFLWYAETPSPEGVAEGIISTPLFVNVVQ